MGFIYIGRVDELKGIKILFKTWKLMDDKVSELKAR
jgi:glycosyltransferase involved in cell wall biosynthesis